MSSILSSLKGFLTKHGDELHTVASALEVVLYALPVPQSEKDGILTAVAKLHDSADSIKASVDAIHDAVHGDKESPEPATEKVAETEGSEVAVAITHPVAAPL